MIESNSGAIGSDLADSLYVEHYRASLEFLSLDLDPQRRLFNFEPDIVIPNTSPIAHL